MKEQFDKRLVEKIKGSFEDYEEPFDPKEWEKFSEAYFNKNKPKPLWVWTTLISGIAASLVIGFLIWPSVEETSREKYIGYDHELPMASQRGTEEEQPFAERDIEESLPPREGEQITGNHDRQSTYSPTPSIGKYSKDPQGGLLQPKK